MSSSSIRSTRLGWSIAMLLAASPAMAAVVAGGASSTGEWATLAGPEQHIRSRTVTQIVADDRLVGLERASLCVTYVRVDASGATGGRVQLTLEIDKAGGPTTRRRVRLSPRFDDGIISKCRNVTLPPLELGDRLVWRYRFLSMPPLTGGGFFFEGSIEPR